MPKIQAHWIHSILLAALLTSGATTLADDKIYRVKDQDGNTVFTDKPPAGTNENRVDEIVIDEDNSNIADSEKTVTENHPKWLKEAQEKRAKQAQENKQAYQAALENWQEKYNAAQARVEQAELELLKGKEVKEGDFIGFANQHGARPSYQYLKRVEDLSAALAKAQQHLADVKKQKPRLRN